MQRQFIYFILLSLIVAIFVLSNSDVMRVQLFFWSYTLSGSLVILISIALGGLLVFLFGLIKQVQRHLKLKDLEKQNQALSAELTHLQSKQTQLEQEIEKLKAELNQLSLEEPKQSIG
jgi:uncharacterized integral membrane protein